MVHPTLAVLALAFAEEVRERYDAQGHVVHRMVFDGATLVRETRWVWQDGLQVEEQTVEGGHVTVKSWIYQDGRVVEERLAVDGVLKSTRVTTWDGGKVAQVVITENGQSRTTTYVYDVQGRLVATETRGPDGALTGRTLAEHDAPEIHVPLKFTVDAGGSYLSDVETTGASLGFQVSRRPTPEQYEEERVEFRAGGSYGYSASQGTVLNSRINSFFGLDYNEVLPGTTVFLYSDIERNVPANLALDLELAPAGLKVDLINTGGFRLDASFAPVWNYRIIVAQSADCAGLPKEGDTVCESSLPRGSLRVRSQYDEGMFQLSGQVEYLPVLLLGDPQAALVDQSIFRATGTAAVRLSKRISLREELKFTRDPALAATVDCEANPDNLLCDGVVLTNTTSLTFAVDF